MINRFYYENEFEEKLLKLIRNNYGLKENEKKYMIMRFMIINNINNINKINSNDFIDFILTENNLPKKLIYKNSEISLHRKDIQSIKNIVNNWLFELNNHNSKNILNDKNNIESNLKNVISETKRNTSNLKKNNFYKKYYLYKALNNLNTLFNVELKSFVRMNNLEYQENHNDLERYLEEKLLAEIQLYEFNNKNNIDFITEKDLENYLKYNLNKIEKGLKLIDFQYQLDDIYLDILAKDKNNNYVIIELKTKQDERLIWQAIYYPMKFKEKYKSENIRMICISPKYEDFLLKPLKTIKGIELFEYSLQLEQKKINDIKMNKVKL